METAKRVMVGWIVLDPGGSDKRPGAQFIPPDVDWDEEMDLAVAP